MRILIYLILFLIGTKEVTSQENFDKFLIDFFSNEKFFYERINESGVSLSEGMIENFFEPKRCKKVPYIYFKIKGNVNISVFSNKKIERYLNGLNYPLRESLVFPGIGYDTLIDKKTFSEVFFKIIKHKFCTMMYATLNYTFFNSRINGRIVYPLIKLIQKDMGLVIFSLSYSSKNIDNENSLNELMLYLFYFRQVEGKWYLVGYNGEYPQTLMDIISETY